jgi:membrane-associated phospholipid phosphatase
MALFTTDRITGDEIAKFDDQRTASRIMSAPGSIYGVGAIAATFYAVGRKQHNARARETGILIAEGSVNSLIVSNGLKLITQRVRPQTGVERSEFFDGGDSFPSGHSIQAWSMATIVANEYRDHRMVQVAAYGIAGAVSVARFTSGKHYISDAVVGSLIGYGIGKYVYKAHHRESPGTVDENDLGRGSHWPTIVPDYNRSLRQYSLGLSWSF